MINNQQKVQNSVKDEAVEFYKEHRALLEGSQFKDYDAMPEMPKNERIQTIRLSNTTRPMVCTK